MKFTKDADVNGTSLQGYMPAYLHQLIEVFGEPEGGGAVGGARHPRQQQRGVVVAVRDADGGG